MGLFSKVFHPTKSHRKKHFKEVLIGIAVTHDYLSKFTDLLEISLEEARDFNFEELVETLRYTEYASHHVSICNRCRTIVNPLLPLGFLIHKDNIKIY